MPDRIYYRYVAASAAALGVDFATFMAALAVGIPPAVSAAAGYCVGIVFSWLLSSRVVFTESLAATGASRRQQQALFVVSALVGLGITTGIVGAASRWGLDPRLAKGIAIVVSFQATYLLRRRVVFA